MKKKSKVKGKRNTSKVLSREYLHSLSRIGDRLKTLKRDVKNLRTDLNRDLTDLEDDARMLSDAFDSLFDDLKEKIRNGDEQFDMEKI